MLSLFYCHMIGSSFVLVFVLYKLFVAWADKHHRNYQNRGRLSNSSSNSKLLGFETRYGTERKIRSRGEGI